MKRTITEADRRRIAATVFYTPAMRAWLHGYQPVLADQMLAGRSAVRDREAASRSRDAQIENGTGWGTGTLSALSNKSDPGKARVPAKPKKARQPA